MCFQFKPVTKLKSLSNVQKSVDFFVCVSPTDFPLFGVAFILLNFFQFLTNLKIYSGKPNISFKFNS